MGRLARTQFPAELLANMTRHCATEANHAALLTELLAELGGELDPSLQTMQEHYSREGGVPTELVDLLVLSEVLEHRVLEVYGEQLQAPGLHPRVRAVLEEILREEEEHGDGEDCWLEQRFAPCLLRKSKKRGASGARLIARSRKTCIYA